MKNKKKIIILIGIVLLLAYLTYPWFFSAGGVGSIAKYELKLSKKQLEDKIQELITNDPEVGLPDTSIYNLKGTGYEEYSRYIYFVEKNRDTLVFRYAYSRGSETWQTDSTITIGLTHVGYYRESPLQSDKDLFFTKNRWKGLFSKVISKVEN